MSGNVSAWLPKELADVVEEIGESKDWSKSKTIGNLLKTAPEVREALTAKGFDPDKLEPIGADQEARRAS